MPEYRRLFIPGATYFFTLATHERRPWMCTAPAREAVATVRETRPFAVEALVLLPDHLHCIWTLPPGDADYATRWRLIKRAVSVRLAGEPDGALSDSRRRRGERGLWQRRFWEHAVRDARDFEAHCDYIHFNPVKHTLCPAPRDWPWSTFHRFVARGLLPGHWGCEGGPADGDLRVGE
jgi:putative transposase